LGPRNVNAMMYERAYGISGVKSKVAKGEGRSTGGNTGGPVSAGDFTERPITETGMDRPFLIACCMFATSLVVVPLAIWRLREASCTDALFGACGRMTESYPASTAGLVL